MRTEVTRVEEWLKHRNDSDPRSALHREMFRALLFMKMENWKERLSSKGGVIQ